MTQANSRPEPRLDKSMRAKQLASTVRQGRKVTFAILDEDQVTGYLCGWDDDTYFVIHPAHREGDDPIKLLIPKGNILWIELHDDRTFFEESDHGKMESTVQAFKDWVNNNYFTKAR